MSDDLIKGTKMKEQWDELKETIIELRDNNGTATQQEVCQFLANLMNVLETQMEPERKKGKWKPFDRTWGRSIYHCTACGEAEDCPTEMGKVIWKFCPNCGAQMEANDAKIH